LDLDPAISPDRRRFFFLSNRPHPGSSEPVRLGPEVNSGRTRFNAFIAPDESYIIVCV